MAKREKEVVEGRGVGREEQDFLLRESSFPSPLSSVQIFNGFGILHPPSTVLYRARLRDDFARFYICMYVYVYICVCICVYIRGRAGELLQVSVFRQSFYRQSGTPLDSPNRMESFVCVPVSLFRIFFLEMKVFEDLYSSDRWSQKFVFS